MQIAGALGNAVFKQLSLALTQAVPRQLNVQLPKALAEHTVRDLTPVLSQSLTRSIVPALAHTLGDTPANDYYCMLCKQHKRYCVSCSRPSNLDPVAAVSATPPPRLPHQPPPNQLRVPEFSPSKK